MGRMKDPDPGRIKFPGNWFRINGGLASKKLEPWLRNLGKNLGTPLRFRARMKPFPNSRIKEGTWE